MAFIPPGMGTPSGKKKKSTDGVTQPGTQVRTTPPGVPPGQMLSMAGKAKTGFGSTPTAPQPQGQARTAPPPQTQSMVATGPIQTMTPNVVVPRTGGKGGFLPNQGGGLLESTVPKDTQEWMAGQTEEQQMYDDLMRSHQEGWAATQEGIQGQIAAEQRRNAAINAAMGRSVGGGFAAGSAQAALGGAQLLGQARAEHERGTRALLMDQMDRERRERERREDKNFQRELRTMDLEEKAASDRANEPLTASEEAHFRQLENIYGSEPDGSAAKLVDHFSDPYFMENEEGQKIAQQWNNQYSAYKAAVDATEQQISGLEERISYDSKNKPDPNTDPVAYGNHMRALNEMKRAVAELKKKRAKAQEQLDSYVETKPAIPEEY